MRKFFKKKNAAIFSASAGDTLDKKASSPKWTDGFLRNVIPEMAARTASVTVQ